MKNLFKIFLPIISIFLVSLAFSFLFKEDYGDESFDFLSSNFLLTFFVQIILFFIFFFIFKLDKKGFVFMLSLFLLVCSFLISGDIIYFGLQDVYWKQTAKSCSVWICPFLGIAVFKLVDNFDNKKTKRQ